MPKIISNDEFYAYIALNKFSRLVMPFIISNDIMIDFSDFLDSIKSLVVPDAVKHVVYDRWKVSVLGAKKEQVVLVPMKMVFAGILRILETLD